MENGEATVLISFDSRLDANAELKASLSAEIRKALEQTDAVGTLVFHSELTENAEVAKIAGEFHVSLGRADWILTAANKTGLPTDEVSHMSLDELLKFQEVSGISSVSVSKFISLEEAKKIALKDAKLDELVQKIVFTREELNRNRQALLPAGVLHRDESIFLPNRRKERQHYLRREIYHSFRSEENRSG